MASGSQRCETVAERVVGTRWKDSAATVATMTVDEAALFVNEGAPPLQGSGLEMLARQYMSSQNGQGFPMSDDGCWSAAR